MSTISNKIIEMSYFYGKKVLLKDISEKDYIRVMNGTFGMSEPSSKMYLKALQAMREAQCYKRHINKAALQYFLKNIKCDFGIQGLNLALKSLKKHIEYLEEKKLSHKYQSEVYNKFKNTLLLTQKDDNEKQINYKYESFMEGNPKLRYITTYERNPKLREEAIRIHGCVCAVCGFDFNKTYGELGKGYIHIHHKVPVSELEEPKEVNPKTDLVPLCANCHSMIHRKKKSTLKVEELQELLIIV